LRGLAKASSDVKNAVCLALYISIGRPYALCTDGGGHRTSPWKRLLAAQGRWTGTHGSWTRTRQVDTYTRVAASSLSAVDARQCSSRGQGTRGSPPVEGRGRVERQDKQACQIVHSGCVSQRRQGRCNTAVRRTVTAAAKRRHKRQHHRSSRARASATRSFQLPASGALLTCKPRAQPCRCSRFRTLRASSAPGGRPAGRRGAAPAGR